jgi:hypothetical protein
MNGDTPSYALAKKVIMSHLTYKDVIFYSSIYDLVFSLFDLEFSFKYCNVFNINGKFYIYLNFLIQMLVFEVLQNSTPDFENKKFGTALAYLNKSGISVIKKNIIAKNKQGYFCIQEGFFIPVDRLFDFIFGCLIDPSGVDLLDDYVPIYQILKSVQKQIRKQEPIYKGIAYRLREVKPDVFEFVRPDAANPTHP